MCVIVAKHFSEIGWAIAKNRDRNYRPKVVIRRSWRNGIERLLFFDKTTMWSEGVNEYGVCILSTAVIVKDDETEIVKAKASESGRYYSPDGLRVRKALFEKTARDAMNVLIDLQITGNTFIADTQDCFLVEGATNPETGKYEVSWKKLLPGQTVVRTNHGIDLPYAGYRKDGEKKEKASRESSENRYDVVKDSAIKAKTPHELFSALSDLSHEDPQMNPLRIDKRSTMMKTTAQILMIPSERCLHYRPIFCDVAFKSQPDMEGKEKTSFEIVSNRELLSFKHFCVDEDE